MTTEEFIKKSKLIFGDKLDYSITTYDGIYSRVSFICKKHQIVFSVIARNHIKKKCGCPKCNARNKLSNTEDFITKAKKIYGNKYDYSLVNYLGNKIKVKIICSKHGIFEMTPNSHIGIHGHGCPKCAHNYMVPLVELLKESNIIHNNEYDYSKVKNTFKSKSKKVTIICPRHGEFKMSLKNHINNKQRCPKCRGMYKTTEDFIREAKEIHKDKYDYSKTTYIDSYTMVKIICKKHGIFSILPTMHVSAKQGCPKCIGRYKTNDEFIKEVMIIHRNKYDYSKTVYEKSSGEIIIICPKHGEFHQVAANHLSGRGCPHCKSSTGEGRVKKFLTEHNLNFKQQKTFSDCRNINRLQFDFYLIDLNTCVEYDGRQHFEPVKAFGGEKGFKQTKINDKIKTNYCKNNNIPLIRIRYDENVEEVLKSKLNIV